MEDVVELVLRSADFDPWVRFFTGAVRAEAEAARRCISALSRYRAATEDRLRRYGLKDVIIASAEQLIERPVLTPT